VVADTYNGKLRHLEASTGEVRTLAAGLSEPGGLAWDAARGAWLVADTNAHRVVRVTPDGRIEPLDVRGAPSPARGRLPRAERTSSSTSGEFFTRRMNPREGHALAPGPGALAFHVTAPDGKKLAAGSPLVVTLEVSRRSDLLVLDATELRLPSAGGATQRLEVPVHVQPFDAEQVDAEMVARIDAVVCDLDADAPGAVCEPWRAFMRLPVTLAKGGGARVEME
jgi:hypothetical protein